jgi:hypothetical protein
MREGEEKKKSEVLVIVVQSYSNLWGSGIGIRIPKY